MSQGKALELTGTQFPYFKVIQKTDKRHGKNVLWECVCECGNTFLAVAGALSKNRIKSCGCKNKKPNGVSAFNRLYKNYRLGAKKRNILFLLTKQDVEVLSKHNCYYCHVEPKQIIKSDYNSGDYIYNGIDRIDNTKGYTLDNVVSCCGKCNAMKSIMGAEDFISQCHKISSAHKKDNK